MGTGTGVRLQIRRPLSSRHLQTEDAERRHRASKPSPRPKCRQQQHRRQGNNIISKWWEFLFYYIRVLRVL